MTPHSTTRKNTRKLRIFAIFLLLVGLLAAFSPRQGSAQTNSPELVLLQVDKKDFPKIKLEFEIRHASPAQLATPLKASDITIFEGDQQMKASKLESQYMGTHFMLAINTARNLALVDENRITNYDKLMSSIKTMGSQLAPESGDHFSLFINPDSEWHELGNFSEWVQAIDSYEDVYGMRRLNPDFASLSLSLEAFENSKLDQETVLVYVTPYILPRNKDQLMEIVHRSAELRLPLHVWMVLETASDTVPYETELSDALQVNGGSLTLFSNGSEELPDPKAYIAGMGYRYTVEYESSLRSTEDVELSLNISTAAINALKSQTLNLSVMIEPAQLRFQNLVSELPIQLDKDGNASPRELPLEVSIEFIDNYPREIVSTSLWINGKKAKENLAPPYGSFLLDLAPYTETTALKLEARLTDSWGLQGSTGQKNLDLTITKPESFIKEVSSGFNKWLIAGLASGILILALIFILPGQRNKKKERLSEQPSEASRPSTNDKPTAKPTKKRVIFSIKKSLGQELRPEEPDQAKTDTSSQEDHTTPQTSPELSLPPARHYGSLLKLDQDSTPSAVKPFLLTKPIIYIGRDPKLADLVLNDPAIDPLHAELKLFEDGRATLTDFKTTAGTYRNYKPISANAAELQHGDILHFGTVMYRFHSATRTSSPKADSEPKPNESEEP